MPASTDPTKRSRTNTRARIIDAAFEVFAERGFGAATVEEVCEVAGFTRGAFYSNFATMDELFFALWTSRADAIVGTLSDLVADLVDHPDRLEETLGEIARRVTDDRRWFLVNTEFLLHAMRNPAAAETLAAHRRLLRTGLAQVIDQVSELRGTELPDGLDTDRYARLIIAGIEGCQHQIWIEPDVLGDGQLQEAMLRRFVV